MLERGLALLGFCDEIVVVVDARTDRPDRGDRTAPHGPRVGRGRSRTSRSTRTPRSGRARGDWLLIVDADERITPGARARDRGDARARPRRVGVSGSTRSTSSSAAGCGTARWNDDHLRLIRKERARLRGQDPRALRRAARADGQAARGHVALLAPLDRGHARQDDPLRRGAGARAVEPARRRSPRSRLFRVMRARVPAPHGAPARLEGRHAGHHRGDLSAVLAVLRVRDAVAAPAPRDAVGVLRGARARRRRSTGEQYVGNVDLERLEVGPGDRVVDARLRRGRAGRAARARRPARHGVEPAPVPARALRGAGSAPVDRRRPSSTASPTGCRSATARSAPWSPPRCSSTSPDPEAALRELHRVMRPGAILCLSVPTSLHRAAVLAPAPAATPRTRRTCGSSPSPELRRLVDVAGFDVVALGGAQLPRGAAVDVPRAAAHPVGPHRGQILGNALDDARRRRRLARAASSSVSRGSSSASATGSGRRAGTSTAGGADAGRRSTTPTSRSSGGGEKYLLTAPRAGRRRRRDTRSSLFSPDAARPRALGAARRAPWPPTRSAGVRAGRSA